MSANEERVVLGRRAVMLLPDVLVQSRQESLADTLANLMHFARGYGLDFPAALASAQTYYEAERLEGSAA